MKSILEIYSRLWEDSKKERFLNETFNAGVYKDALPKLTIVDIGAFHGDFSFYCLPFARRIYAIEPSPVSFTRMKEYIKEFEAEDIIKSFNCAIGRDDGIRRMSLSDDGGGKFKDDGDSEIQTYSLKTFMLNNGIEKIDILKVDIEGSEREIFSGNFGELVFKIDLIIGEHSGFELLKNYGYIVEKKPDGVFLAKKT